MSKQPYHHHRFNEVASIYDMADSQSPSQKLKRRLRIVKGNQEANG